MFDLIYPTPAGLDKLKGKNQPATHRPATTRRTFRHGSLGKRRPPERSDTTRWEKQDHLNVQKPPAEINLIS